MANIRNLKKDVEFLSQDLFANVCFQSSIEAIDTTAASHLVIEIAEFKKYFIAKINNPGVDTKDAKAIRAAFKGIREEIFAKFADIASKIAKK